jgi:hypothetical protein
MLNTPGGRPASLKISQSRIVVSGGIFRRLHHGRAPGREGRREVARGYQQGMIEGRDVGDDTHRAAQRIAEVVAVNGDDRIALRQRQARVIAEQVRHFAKLRPGFAGRPSVVQRLEFIEFVQMRLDRIAELVNQFCPGALRHLAPLFALEGAAGAGNGRIDVGFIGIDSVGDDFAGSR